MGNDQYVELTEGKLKPKNKTMSNTEDIGLQSEFLCRYKVWPAVSM